MTSTIETVETAIRSVAGSPALATAAAQAWGQNSDKLSQLGANTDARIASIIGQCAFESQGFRLRFENLNYSANALVRIFGRYFDAATAAEYARQPEKIANRIYANRMGNGDEASGDGYRYRGRGWIQLTGRANYAAYSKGIGVDLVANPDSAAEPATAWLIAVQFFANRQPGGRSLLEWADAGDETMVTRGINGGTMGLAGREQNVEKVTAALNGKISMATWQTLLAGAGFDPGGIDGIDGPNTQKAMAAAEQKYGKSGEELAQALEAAQT